MVDARLARESVGDGADIGDVADVGDSRRCRRLAATRGDIADIDVAVALGWLESAPFSAERERLPGMIFGLQRK